jgi:hypothetical protein
MPILGKASSVFFTLNLLPKPPKTSPTKLLLVNNLKPMAAPKPKLVSFFQPSIW